MFLFSFYWIGRYEGEAEPGINTIYVYSSTSATRGLIDQPKEGLKRSGGAGGGRGRGVFFY